MRPRNHVDHYSTTNIPRSIALWTCAPARARSLAVRKAGRADGDHGPKIVEYRVEDSPQNSSTLFSHPAKSIILSARFVGNVVDQRPSETQKTSLERLRVREPRIIDE